MLHQVTCSAIYSFLSGREQKGGKEGGRQGGKEEGTAAPKSRFILSPGDYEELMLKGENERIV